MYYYLGRFPAAVQMFRKATDQGAQDHRVWGNLGDALFQIPDKRAEAERSYRRAIQLAERELVVNPKDEVVNAEVAYFYSRIGKSQRARNDIARALELRPDVVWVHYYAALVALETTGRDAALKSLERAIELGYPPGLVRTAPEFSSLRGDPRFEQLLAPATRISAK